MILKAHTQAKMVDPNFGTSCTEVDRQINKLLNPVIPWETLLDNFLSTKIKEDYSWSKPNRRFYPDMYLPSQESEGLGNITIAIDTSGSIEDNQLNSILSEIAFIKDKFKPKELTILDCDWEIHNIHKVDESTDILSLKFSGGGGTQLSPVFEYCDKQPPEALIYFTDLHARQITEEPEYPVLWICYSNHEEAPIGTTIYTEF